MSRTTPRELSNAERDGLIRVADALIPSGSTGTCPSSMDGYEERLIVALAARRDCFEKVVRLAVSLQDGQPKSSELLARLRLASEDEDSGFVELSAVIAGAYLMDPAVRAAIGYPGQAQRAARFDEAAEEIMDGVLDPVLNRGSVFRDPATAERIAR